MSLEPTQPKTGVRLVAILRTSVVVFLFLVGAKLLNFLKKILIGQLFGVSWVADAFFAASFLPYYLTIFFEGVLFLGFLPLFSTVMAEKGKEEANQFVTEILFLIFLLTGFLAALAWWGAPWVIHELVPGFSANEQNLTRSLFQILSLVIIFISLTSFFKVLNSYFEHYAWAASSALVDTVVMIGMTLMVWKRWGIYGAAWAAVAGAFTAFIFQAIFFIRKHPIFPKHLLLQSAWLFKLLFFLIPMGAIWAFQQIPLVIFNRFGSGMWEGTISALVISQTLSTVPMGLVNHTVLFAIFPSLAKQANETTPENLRETFFQTLRGGFLILVPIGFLLTALARPLAALFFDGGGIAQEGTRRIANSLTCFGWASFALYADLFMTQSLIAVRKTLPAIFLSGFRAVLRYGFGYVLSTLWDYQGLALSFSLALVVNFFILFPLFFRMSPFNQGWKNLFVYTAKLALAASPVLGIGWLVSRWSITEWMAFSEIKSILGVGALSLMGIGSYLLLLFLLRVEEIHSVFQELKRGWSRRNWWLAEQTD